MCLEVEEVMYQDTVKYVENQAQKVSASVKKFYSEVMQDLVPSSDVDPVKVAAGDLSLNPYAHTDLSKSPKSFLLDSQRERKKIKSEDEAISDTNLPSLCSGVFVQNTSSDLCSSKGKKLGVYRRPIGIKRISQLDRPSKVANPATSLSGLGCSEGDGCGSHMRASGDMNAKSSSVSVETRDPEPVNESLPVSHAKIKSSVTDKLISAGSVRQKKDESECASSLDTAIKNDSFVESSPDRSGPCDAGFPVEEVVVSTIDNIDMEVIQNEEIAEPDIETSEAFEVSNLEETCVFVEGGNLDFVSPGSRKHKSYKVSCSLPSLFVSFLNECMFDNLDTSQKKIRDALSSKLRSTRKDGHKDLSRKNNPEEMIPALSIRSGRKQKLTDQDSLESEWELL
ncbi:hypothetical protein F511_23175 [Dorcoceras hygrometricum]|uniref:Uncharacterized protein n=1 Tax=Dorcoceras hygrometricum TaxID=472368 RepID=A0A2Z7CZS1_9LAMI|nr:hypothetical protein F511_23175 [Dorcoceras hygrometricum]